MQFTLAVDNFNRLICTLHDGNTTCAVTASNPEALDDLLTAIQDTETRGMGECLWQEATGEYRWILRTDAGRLRLAILWSTGTLTGWEHVLWSESDFSTFRDTVQAESNRIRINA